MANEIEGLAKRETELSQALEGLTREIRNGGKVALSSGATSESALGPWRGADSVVDALRGVSRSTDGLDRGLGENTNALRDASSALGSGLKGLLSGLSSGLGGGGFGLGSLLKSGFGLAPLVSGIAKLFGGGDKKEAPVLETVATPPALDLSLANMAGPVESLPQADRGAGGGVRTAAPAQVVVNVSAMDARGFMDRSDDIAAAVRDAMLRMHAVNDVVEEL